MIYWLSFILIESLFNYYLIEVKKVTINHKLMWSYRAVVGIVIAALTSYSWIEFITKALAFGCAFWWTFDPLLNKLRGKDLDYKGKESGWWDSLPRKWYWFFKWSAMAYLITFIIYGNR